MRALERYLEQHFLFAISLCCLFYFGLEARYISHLPLVMDEFQGAWTVHRLAHEVPYVDFTPYKTVLGYYLQLLPILLSDDPWLQIMFVKLSMAALTAVAIFLAARMLATHFERTAVFLATVALVFMSTFLERSAVLRVDMLTSLFGLFGLLFLLERRVVLAGLLAGASFVVSQKGAYYVFCSAMAAGSYCVLLARDRHSLRDLLRFSIAALAPIALYFAFWALVSSPAAVYHQVFVKNRDIAFKQLYEIRHYWFQTLYRNPAFWALAVLSLGQLFTLRTKSAHRFRDWCLLVYGGTLFVLCIWHKQPWPYFFVLLIPTAFVLIASFYDVELRRSNGLTLVAALVFLLLCVAFPARRIPVVLARDNSVQRFTVDMGNHLLDEGDTYLAGVEMIHTRRQVSSKLAWLDARRLHALSLEDPNELIRFLDEGHLKLVITNHRIPKLPDPVLGYLLRNYYPLNGNLLFYAPTVDPGAHEISLPFEGTYVLLGPPGASLEIDGGILREGERIRLAEGAHRVSATTELRLRLLPAKDYHPSGAPNLVNEQVLFDNVYNY